MPSCEQLMTGNKLAAYNLNKCKNNQERPFSER